MINLFDYFQIIKERDFSAYALFPVTAVAFLAELPPRFFGDSDLSMFFGYMICVLGSIFFCIVVIAVVSFTCSMLQQFFSFMRFIDLLPLIGILIFPFGFSAVFPDYFEWIDHDASHVGGLAIIVWSFFFMSRNLEWIR